MSSQLSAICAALEYIENNLRADITVAEIAAAAGYSLYHFIRTFNHTVQHTPYDYLMRRRLSTAALKLLESDRRILDIAVDLQFKNHETFSRAFKRMFGIQPSQWRGRGFVPYQSLMPRLRREFLEFINSGDFVHPTVVECPEVHLMGLMSTGGDKKTLEQQLREMLVGAGISYGERSIYGISSHPQTQKGVSFYSVGIETNAPESINLPFIHQKIPAGLYAQLSVTQDGHSRAYFYHTWLPKSDFRVGLPVEIRQMGAAGVFIPLENKKQPLGDLHSKGLG
jgi:AraC family transcriptional regulator